MQAHEAADLMPLDEDRIPDLAADIKANGLIDPIELLDGKMIDGRRRLRACAIAGVEPRFKDVQTSDPVAYVLSKQNRRELTPSQRAMIGARAVALREKLIADAKERQREAGRLHGRGKEKVEEPVPQPTPRAEQSRDQIGKLVGVTGRTIQGAVKVIEKGAPELVKAVDEGRMAVKAAAAIADLSHDDQRAALAKPKPGSGARRDRKARTAPPQPAPVAPVFDASLTRPPWAQLTEHLSHVASLLEAMQPTKEEETEPWKLVTPLEELARTLLRKARDLRQRHHL